MNGSLFPHNVVLHLLGEDFGWQRPHEWDWQYANYSRLMEYINNNKETFKDAEVRSHFVSVYFPKSFSYRIHGVPKLH